MKNFKILSIAAMLALSLSASDITLDGKGVTPQEIARIANGAKVKIDDAAMQKVKKAHEKTGRRSTGLPWAWGLIKTEASSMRRGIWTRR